MTIITNTTADRESYTIKEYGLLNGMSPDTVRRRIADGTIQAVRIGRLIRIPAGQKVGRPVGNAR